MRRVAVTVFAESAETGRLAGVLLSDRDIRAEIDSGRVGSSRTSEG